MKTTTLGQSRRPTIAGACGLLSTRFLALLVLLLATSAQSAQWLQDGREPPLHPSIIVTQYGGAFHPVTAAAGEVPEIEAGGKMSPLKIDAGYQITRAMGYAPGFVRFEDQNASSHVWVNPNQFIGPGGANSVLAPNGIYAASGEYECTLVSTEALVDCYVAVVFFRDDAGGQPEAAADAVAFRQVGELTAGRATKVAIHSSYIARPGARVHYFPMLFSKGLEIRSDQSELEARYFRRGEMIAHEEILQRYQKKYPESDRPAEPYLRFRPELPVGVSRQSLPSKINAKFVVTETGEVDSVELYPVPDLRVEQEIRRALDGWLFLPRLEKGYPRRTLFEVPLSFDSASR
jgi:hypothetical protein